MEKPHSVCLSSRQVESLSDLVDGEIESSRVNFTGAERDFRMAYWTELKAALAPALAAALAGALRESQPLGPVKRIAQCTKCGHTQTAKGTRHADGLYWGSSAVFCDQCEGNIKLGAWQS